ncbi:putative NADH-dependent oxidoreductase-possiblyglucose-fructose dependent oxidoreductase [Lentisphaera araneosa HTCC2155]|jgi:predicted dehydrogenase|uniref:Putative NADH-dependent oxidoreductase-possiblyglucose-fructose dependent oxidoreductase n=1 Tax=Lentisphaera araneosa HTCC2155 TaxID=313628 RepID=A6DJP7_9BACT|nr:Gfo/Idh/MocA family oxidoreductase [Lentisphaera araneosa]EDM28121.1 putative NADH-dependent oxidoreductase-possiblyglucose-fructose dependent oxidoreductase [Lentisphaera araneosa HTCC2155]
MKTRIAIVGLGFGAEFIPIYQKHPDADLVAICQRNEKSLNEVGDQFGIEKRFTSYEELLKDPDIDAVHINTPIPNHGAQSIQALKAGKHVACTVPMATSLEECQEIVRLCEEKNLKYMMMETVVYAREFLYMKDLYEKGELGKVQFLKASHQQDMDGWPNYWPGLPPMHYATHCVGPVLGLTRSEAEEVSCFGSGTIREELISEYNSPFAVESCHIKFKDSDLTGHVYRSLFDTARQYRESFEVYGSEKSVEWPLVENEELVVHTAKKPEPEIPSKVECPDFAHLLPKEIQSFTTHGVYNNDGEEHLSFTQGAGHGGSHPHLVHQFVDMLKTGEDSYPNARQSANITCVGILAHESALQGGITLKLPEFTLRKS